MEKKRKKSAKITKITTDCKIEIWVRIAGDGSYSIRCFNHTDVDPVTGLADGVACERGPGTTVATYAQDFGSLCVVLDGHGVSGMYEIFEAECAKLSSSIGGANPLEAANVIQPWMVKCEAPPKGVGGYLC